MEFYVGQKLKFKEEWDHFQHYDAGEVVEVVAFDCDGDPEIKGKGGMDYFFYEDLACLVEEDV